MYLIGQFVVIGGAVLHRASAGVSGQFGAGGILLAGNVGSGQGVAHHVAGVGVFSGFSCGFVFEQRN